MLAFFDLLFWQTVIDMDNKSHNIFLHARDFHDKMNVLPLGNWESARFPQTKLASLVNRVKVKKVMIRGGVSARFAAAPNRTAAVLAGIGSRAPGRREGCTMHRPTRAVAG